MKQKQMTILAMLAISTSQAEDNITCGLCIDVGVCVSPVWSFTMRLSINVVNGNKPVCVQSFQLVETTIVLTRDSCRKWRNFDVPT